MHRYLMQRLALFIPTLVLVSLIVFCIMRIIPGDPALLILSGGGEARVTQEELARLRHQLGTDRPMVVQYGAWVWDALRGNLGQSLWDNTPVVDQIQARFPVTLELAAMAILIAMLLAVPLGVLSAVTQDTGVDYTARIFTVTFIAAPTFWIGILVIVVLAKFFHWLPPLEFARPWQDPLTNVQQLIFPALALGLHDIAFIARVTRSAVLEVLREDYVRTARAKGLREGIVIFRHALQNAFLPVLTVAGWQFGRLMGGVVLIEAIFLVPGTGSLLIDSLSRRDFPMIQALILLAAVVVLAVNLMVDILYGWLDPRIRYG